LASCNSVESGRYLYCIAKGGKEADLGKVGIEDNDVYTVPFDDIGAVVHRCEAKPYITNDRKKAEEWILSHQYVIDLATEEFGTVIPLTFDTIIRGDDRIVKQWLLQEYNQLRDKLEELEGEAEFGVQVFIDKAVIEKLDWENNDTQRLRKELETKSEGAAYLLRKKLEKKLKLEKRTFIERHAKTFCSKIRELVDDMRLESLSKEVPGRWKEKEMILNLACLAPRNDIQPLGRVLNEINRLEGFAVRFTGPWPPYSFVGDVEAWKER